MSRSRTGIQSKAATAAASIDSPRRVFSSPVGDRPSPSTISRYEAATIAASPAMVMVCTRSRSMRTAMRSDAPSASDNGTSTVVLTTTARIGSGHATSSCSTHAVSEIAVATTTAHAGHWSRARSCTPPAARHRATYPTRPITASALATITTGQSATCGRSFEQVDRDDRTRGVARGAPEPAGTRAQRAVGEAEHEVECDRGEERHRDAAEPGAEVAHGVGGDVAPGERGAEEHQRADRRRHGHDLGQRLTRTVHGDEDRGERPGSHQHRAQHPSGAERHTVADERGDHPDRERDDREHDGRGGARRPRRALAHVVADARELQGFHVVEAGDHVTPIVGRLQGACVRRGVRALRRRG